MSETAVSSPLSKTRVGWADILKGLAIIFIYFGHTIYTPSVLKLYFSIFHVAIFFFISGYFFSLKYDFKTFIVGKLKRLIIPLILFGFASTGLISLLEHFINGTAIDFKAIFLYPFIQMPYTIGSKDFGWFIACLFVALILFRIIAKICKNKKVIILLVSLALSGAAYLFYKYTAITLPWHIVSACEALPVFAVAYLLRKSKTENVIFNPYFIPIYLISLIIFGYLNYKYFCEKSYVTVHVSFIGNWFLYYFSAFSGIFMTVSIAKLISNSKILEFLGKNTIVFYLLECAQYFLNYILRIVLSIINIDTWYVNLIATTVGIALVFAILSFVCILINRFCPFILGETNNKNHKSIKFQ